MTRARTLLVAALPLAALLLAAPAQADSPQADSPPHSAQDSYDAGRALERAGQTSSALSRYLKALLVDGPPHEGAARRLARMDPAFPLPPSELRALASRDLSTLPSSVRDGLRHRIGLFQLRSGDLDGARRSLAPIRTAQARYLLALIAVRQGRLQAAGGELEQALTDARRERKRDLIELVTLSLARIDLERGRLARAEQRYASIGVDSVHFFRSQQELAWLHLQQTRWDGVLAISLALSGPETRRPYYPDRELLQAAALAGLCRHRQALTLARQALARLDSDLKKARKFLRPRREARLYYVEAMASAARGSGDLGALVGALLADSGFRRVFQTVRQLQRERRLAVGPAHRALSTELDHRLVWAQQEAGRVVQNVLGRVAGELVELRTRARELLFDLEGQAVDALRRPERDAPRPGARRVVEKGQQRWPFQGEYWADEIGHYHVDLSRLSRCR